MTFSSLLNIVFVALAFGFVIFWHELGHFLAARWAGVRVEQFAVGMGHAVFSWRKGIGFRLGNTQAEFERKVQEEYDRRHASGSPTGSATGEAPAPTLREQYDIAKELGLGETEYRFNWIPLGGYVKPTGQDDLRPATEVGADDPHAFGAKPVSKRMVIISAGVIMNVILAFILYVVLFLHGFTAPAAVVGEVLPGSPAQAAGIQSGDRILSINGKPQEDYTKLKMNTALLEANTPATMQVDRPGVGKLTLKVTPAPNVNESDMPALGVASASTMSGPEKSDDDLKVIDPDISVLIGEGRIVRVNGQDVSKETDDHVLVQAVQAARGRSVPVVIRYPDGKEKPFDVQPTLMRYFSDPISTPLSIAGMIPRVRLAGLQKDSPADKGNLRPGDVIEQVAVVGTGESQQAPSIEAFMKFTQQAAKDNRQVRLNVIRNGVSIAPVQLDPSFKIDRNRRGIGVMPEIDLGEPVIAGTLDSTPADRAGLKSDERIVAVNATPVKSWPDVIAALTAAPGDVTLSLTSPSGDRDVALPLSAVDHKRLDEMGFEQNLPLMPLMVVRKTHNPFIAASWGWEETKQSLFQVYLTIRRLFEGSVPVSNLSGPVGIFTAGTSAASRGIDWLIWFTALISANLAVVNFLPIPIVDGGLFTFLCVEKLTGRPPSPKIQAAAQIVGLVLLGSLFLFVTYHDILRQWG